MERRIRAAAAGAATFAVVTLAINLPVALEERAGSGLVIRKGWAWFYKFNLKRPPEIVMAWPVMAVTSTACKASSVRT